MKAPKFRSEPDYGSEVLGKETFLHGESLTGLYLHAPSLATRFWSCFSPLLSENPALLDLDQVREFSREDYPGF